MENKLIWSNNMTTDRLLKLPIEEKVDLLIKLDYDPEMIKGKSEEEINQVILDDQSFYRDDNKRFNEVICPMIEKQCKDGIVLLAGDVGRWDGNHKGGKALLPEDLIRLGFDNVEILSDENGNLVFTGSDHDGTSHMRLYALSEEDDKLLEFVTECMDNAIQDEIYFNGTDREEAITDVMDKLDEIDYINDYCDFSKVSEVCEPIKALESVSETLTEEHNSQEDEAEKATIDYYNGKYNLDQLHILLTNIFRSPDKAYIWLLNNDARIQSGKNRRNINEVRANDPKSLAKELVEIKKLASEYGYQYFTSMPFTSFDNDPISLEYQYPNFFKVCKAFFKEMGILTPEELEDTDVLDSQWDTDINQHDWDTIIKVSEIISSRPGKNKQFDKVYHNGLKSTLDDNEILANREKEDELAAEYSEENESLNEELPNKLNPEKISSDIIGIAEENGIFPEIEDFSNGPMGSAIVSFDLNGDWKHEHLFFETLVIDYCGNNGLVLFKSDNEEVGESDEDYYESIHTFYIIKKEDEEKFNGIKASLGQIDESIEDGNILYNIECEDMNGDSTWFRDIPEEEIIEKYEQLATKFPSVMVYRQSKPYDREVLIFNGKVFDDFNEYEKAYKEWKREFLHEDDSSVDKEVEDDIGLDPAPEEAEVKNPVFDAAEKVMAAYQNANKWLDSVKEFVYRDLSCVFFSSFIHGLAHTMPGRFDKFGDILHTVDFKVPYPATQEIHNEPQNIDEVFEIIFGVLDGIKNELNNFIKISDEPYHGMACAAEGLLNEIEGEYPMLFRLQKEWANCNGDLATFDKYVGQYNEHKDELLESLNESGENFYEPWDHGDDEDLNATVYLYSMDYDGTPESLEAIKKDLTDHYVYDEDDEKFVAEVIKRIAAGENGKVNEAKVFGTLDTPEEKKHREDAESHKEYEENPSKYDIRADLDEASEIEKEIEEDPNFFPWPLYNKE